jgi:hypothetical protein
MQHIYYETKKHPLHLCKLTESMNLPQVGKDFNRRFTSIQVSLSGPLKIWPSSHSKMYSPDKIVKFKFSLSSGSVTLS